MLVYEFSQIQNNWKDGVGGSNGNESTNLPINQFQILDIKKISISLVLPKIFCKWVQISAPFISLVMEPWWWML